MNPTVKNHKDKIVGYKAVKKDKHGYYTDGMGRGTKTYYKLGKKYVVEGEPILCENGIHFFRHYCFALDYLEAGNAILKVESFGDVQEDTEKCVTNKIKIIELDYEEEVDDKTLLLCPLWLADTLFPYKDHDHRGGSIAFGFTVKDRVILFETGSIGDDKEST